MNWIVLNGTESVSRGKTYATQVETAEMAGTAETLEMPEMLEAEIIKNGTDDVVRPADHRNANLNGKDDADQPVLHQVSWMKYAE